MDVSRFVVQIGSLARGDQNARSDCDILLINADETSDDIEYALPKGSHKVNSVVYDQAQFQRYFQQGSLFLYHTFFEGRILFGEESEWERLKRSFIVQRDFREEIRDAYRVCTLLRRFDLFGNKLLTPLTNAFIEVKNACIFSLAHRGIFEFNKRACMEKAISDERTAQRMKMLASYYNYSVRGDASDFPVPLDQYEELRDLLRDAYDVTKGMYAACRR